LFEVYGPQNRIRLTASNGVVAAAERSVHDIIKQYSGPNLVLEDLHRIVTLEVDDASYRQDPLKGLAEACRVELAGLLDRI